MMSLNNPFTADVNKFHGQRMKFANEERTTLSEWCYCLASSHI